MVIRRGKTLVKSKIIIESTNSRGQQTPLQDRVETAIKNGATTLTKISAELRPSVCYNI